MTADEARDLLKLFRAELAMFRPADIQARTVIEFFRRMFALQAQQDLAHSRK